ncbi:unnamed protein product [Ceutorhynchus assimilis]|uniref:C-type lectin domain-containing protein n=1 Tax=Ceutorhynchus assimilis TaxID=467358 RepID=A0A9N9MI38_9CUCU|nr:unnamed protein product [Ceutorhynchus assimilis]
MLIIVLLLLPLAVNTAIYFKGNHTKYFSNIPTNWDEGPAGKVFEVATQKVTWYQALILCQQGGMELASISSAEEEAEVEKLLAGYPIPAGVTSGFWISGGRMGACNAAHDFVFFNSGRPVIYSKYALNQPDNAGGKEGCLHIFKDTQNSYYWNDIPCETKFGFICQTRSCCQCS